MVSKQKINREKVQAALNTLCPKCGYSIPPEKIRHVAFDNMECPSCGERFTGAWTRPTGYRGHSAMGEIGPVEI